MYGCPGPQVDSMAAKRGTHICHPYENSLYVMGGYGNDVRNEDFLTFLQSTEVYDSRVNAWMPGTPLPSARSFAASGLFGNSICLLAGITEVGFPSDIMLVTVCRLAAIPGVNETSHQLLSLHLITRDFQCIRAARLCIGAVPVCTTAGIF